MSVEDNLTALGNASLITDLAVVLSPLFAAWCLFGRKIEDIHHISLIIATSATLLANVCMGADIGWTPTVYSDHPEWYIRYISRMIHGPPVLLCLFELTRFEKIFTFVVSLFYTMSLFFSFAGAHYVGVHKWGLYAIATLTLYFIPLALMVAPLSGFHDERYRPLYFRGVKYTVFIWTIYVIYWLLYEGTHVISPFSDMVLGGVLDFASGPGFIWMLIRSRVKQMDSETQEVATTETRSGGTKVKVT